MGSRIDNRQHAETLHFGTQRLINRVVRRLSLAAFGQAWFRASVVLAVLFGVVLLIRRLTGWGPYSFTVGFLIVIPVFGTLAAVLTRRKPTHQEASREIDRRYGTSDLFLTVSQLDSAAGAYQSLIADDAESRAPTLVPAQVVGFAWGRRVATSLAGAATLLAAVLYVPQFDPFGTIEASTSAMAVRRDLQMSRRDTNYRSAELTAQREMTELSANVEKALADLALELQQLRTDRRSANGATLAEQQRKIETQWREMRAKEDVSRLVEQSQATQFFGPSDKRSQEWTQELSQGRSKPLDEVFESLAEKLDQLAQTESEEERHELDKQTRQGIAELQRFAGNQLNSLPMESALQRAKNQLDAGRLDPNLQAESAAAAKESLALAREELQGIAKNAQQLRNLEQALSAIQAAKQLSQSDASQDSSAEDSTVRDFVEQHADAGKQTGQPGKGNSGDSPAGDSQGGESSGQKSGSPSSVASTEPSKSGAGKSGETQSADRNPGRGSSAGQPAGRPKIQPENDSAETAFRRERDSSLVEASRRLLSLRRQGAGESGNSSIEYRQLVQDLQKRVNTAIELEEIPPGYVSGIRAYFDKLEPSKSRSAVDEPSSVESPSKEKPSAELPSVDSKPERSEQGSGEATDGTS